MHRCSKRSTPEPRNSSHCPTCSASPLAFYATDKTGDVAAIRITGDLVAIRINDGQRLPLHYDMDYLLRPFL
jgi:hypothetical protein